MAAVALVALTAAISVARSDHRERFHWGASATARLDQAAIDRVVELDTLLNQPLRTVRLYSLWEDPFPAPDHLWLKDHQRLIVLSIKPQRDDGSIIPWADLADAAVGSTVQTEMTAWAHKIAAFKAPIMIIFHHEPETKKNLQYGTAEDFKRAWIRFVSAVRDAGADNAQFLWTMTDTAFATQALDRRAATRWYPGDEVVDAIGADVYNWFDCRAEAVSWQSFADLAEPLRRFGLEHPTQRLWLPEFGTVEDRAQHDRKAEWFIAATETLRAREWNQFAGAVYFDHLDAAFAHCDWLIETSAESVRAFTLMGKAQLGIDLAKKD